MKTTLSLRSLLLAWTGAALALATVQAAPAAPSVRPRLVDLGADRCIPCRMMAPILAELAQEYAGQFDVVFIDVWKNEQEAERFRIRVIPTQIFFDASGRERFRHEGFLAKKEILAKWRELGLELKPPAGAGKR